MNSKDYDSFQVYLQDVASKDVPTREEEIQFFKRFDKSEREFLSVFLKSPDVDRHIRSIRKKAEIRDDLVALSTISKYYKMKDSGKDLKSIINVMVPNTRYSDSFRDWLDKFTKKAQNTAWGKNVRRLRDVRNSVKSEFVSANLRLVIMVAKKYGKFPTRGSGSSLPLNDLVQEGNMGLMRAVEKFNPGLGNRFSTYSVWWIRHHIRRAMQDGDRLVKIPVHVGDLMSKIARLEQKHRSITGESIGAEDIASSLNINVSKAQRVESARFIKSVYLNDPIYANNSSAILVEDTLEDEKSLDPMEEAFQKSMKDAVRSKLKSLTSREAYVLQMRFGLSGKELTLQEIADQFGLSRERIRQIENKALGMMRNIELMAFLKPTG